MTNFISTGSTYWISDEEIQIFEKNATNGDKNSAFKLYQYHMFVSLDQDLDVNDTLRMYKNDDIRMYNFNCITDTIVEVITTCNTYTLLTVHLL